MSIYIIMLQKNTISNGGAKTLATCLSNGNKPCLFGLIAHSTYSLELKYPLAEFCVQLMIISPPSPIKFLDKCSICLQKSWQLARTLDLNTNYKFKLHCWTLRLWHVTDKHELILVIQFQIYRKSLSHQVLMDSLVAANFKMFSVQTLLIKNIVWKEHTGLKGTKFLKL